MPLSRRIVIAIIVCLVFSLFGIIADTPAQTPHSDRDLFDFPDATDLYCVYHPSSSQAIALVPAEGTASMVFELTAFEDVTLASLTTQDWQTPDLLEVFPGDTVVLRTTDDILYKLTFPAPPHAEAPQLTLHYALLTEDAAIQPQIVAIAYDEALDLDTGDTFLDPTVAAVVFCDVGPIVPTPTPPTPIPEPGSALLVVLGLTGLYVAWKLAQRKGKRSIGLWIVILFSAFVLVSPGVKWLTAQSNLTCTLMVKRDGSGSGLVRGGEIDCGESCRVSHGNGELLHLKAIPDEGSTFSGWLVNGDPSTGLIFMHGDTVLTALFGAVATPTATPTPTPSPSNRAPQAVNDAYTTDEDRLLRVSAPGVLRNDRDPNDDPLQAVLVRPPPSHGELILNADGSFTYTPNAHFAGIDQFIYRVTDGELESAIAVVTITVTGANDAPVAQDLTVNTAQNHPVSLLLHGSDPDDDDLIYQIVDGPAHGTLRGADHAFTYTPGTNFLGQDTFTYLVNDGMLDSNVATVTILVQDVDVAMTGVDISQTVFDPQTLSLSGTVAVSFKNAGAETIAEPYEVQVYVKDLHTNSITVFGAVQIITVLVPGNMDTVDVSICGTLQFKDQPLYAFVDSQNAIIESNENNNITHSMADCQMEPSDPGSFAPVLEWEWTGSEVLPSYNQVMSAPVVANFTDDNGDGVINEHDIPAIIFNTFRGSNYHSDGILRAIRGDGKGEIFTMTSYRTAPGSNPAVGDIDHDGFNEICIIESGGNRLLAFSHEGQLKWATQSYPLNASFSTILIADIDTDGYPEVIVGNAVFHGTDGSLKWKGAAGSGYASSAADLNLDGIPEFISGNTAYYANGAIYWSNSTVANGGLSAVGNFNDDPYPEVVVVGSGHVYLLDHAGQLIWQRTIPGGGFGGAPTVADVDGDGTPEIGVAGGARYVVFEADGTVKWTQSIEDWSSSTTGSSVFDFDGDGRAEVVYADERYIYLFRGETGDILFQEPIGSGTLVELPVIVDVDHDNNAEIVIASNNYYRGPKTGIQVYGDANDSWVNTRKIWNQHSCHITNVNDDGTIPQFEANSWEVHNTYRCNLSLDALACEDYSASYLRVDSTNAPDSVDLTARIGNSGIVDAAVPLHVAFYNGDPLNGGTLLAVTTTQHLLKSGDYEEVTITWENPPEEFVTIYAVVDDDGTGAGKVRESREDNNFTSTSFRSVITVPIEGVWQKTTNSANGVNWGIPAYSIDDPYWQWTTEVWNGPEVRNQPSMDPHAYWTQPFPLTHFWFKTRIFIPPGMAKIVLQDTYKSGGIIPINDNLYVYINGQFMYKNGTGYDSHSRHNSCPETDYWIIPPIDLTGAPWIQGEWNDIWVLTEEYASWGGLGYLEFEATLPNSPIADAGEDQITQVGTEIILDGSGSSDPIDRPLTYRWSIVVKPGGSVASLTEETSVHPMFTPDIGGTYLIQLIVNNGEIESGLDVVEVTVIDNFPPTVIITTPHEGDVFQATSSIQVRAEASDDDGHISHVMFYVDSTFLGKDTTSPYEFDWLNAVPGNHRISVVAFDNEGESTESSSVNILIQPAPNSSPDILSQPVMSVKAGETYTYDVEAADPDGDTLTYSLATAPAGMSIEAASGLISWTPTADQIGEHAVKVVVEDGRGAGASQSFSVYVNPASVNPPQITSTPIFSSRVEQDYRCDVDANDPDGDTLTYRLSRAPEGMTIDPDAGLIRWTPTSTQAGVYTIIVIVDDGQGGIGGQQYSLTILPPNAAPAVTFLQPATGASLEEGRSVSLQAAASDSDGRIAQVEFYVDSGVHTSVCSGANSSAMLCTLAWTAAGLGEHTLYAIACDNEGASTQSETVTVTVIEPLPDTVAPVVDVTAAPQQVQPGDPVSIQITISDASPIESVTVTINGAPLTLNGSQASYTVPANDFYTVVAQATDSAGNTGTGQTVFRAFDGSDNTAPVVDLHDDVERNCVELKADLYDIVGSVSDPHTPLPGGAGGGSGAVYYQLLTREKGVSSWDTLAEGVISPLEGGQGGVPVSAAFDPTLYRNGIHELRLWAQDLAGNEAFVDGCLLLDGRFKVGQASIGGIDVNIPELGFPLLVGRVYDSRNRHDGSFGPGWSLPHEAANVQAEYTYSPSEGWGEEARGSFLKTYYVISHTRKVLVLRLGDGAVFTFRLDLSQKSSLLYPIMDAAFPMNVIYTPQDGTQATLEPIGVSHEVFLLSENGGTLMDWEGNEYAPTRFKLTLEDGTVYIISKDKGIESITDPYGHQISYSDSQIAHFRSTGSGQASGDVLSIERDTYNHIERITDQLGRTIEYRYDEDGMLQQVIQHGEGSYATRVLEHYAYQQGVAAQPVLKDILAPDGTRLGTFEYDSQGRKIGLIDHEGHRVLFGYDAPEHHYTVTDRRGNPTSYTYDSNGNVTAVTDAEGHTESYTYDANGNVLSKTDKLGYTTAYSYDEDGNVLSETDPLGNSMTYTYDADGNRLTETNPLGHTVAFDYDSYGNLTSIKNALGHVTSFSYNADGLKASTTDALGQTSTYGYDPQGNLTTITDPLGYSVTSTYDLYGNALTETDKEGLTITNDYDGQGRLTRTTDQAGKVHEYTHNSSFKIEEYITPLGDKINNSFDPNGNLTVSRAPSGHEVHFDYDPNGNQTTLMTTITTTHDPETFTIETVYDALNRMTEEIDGDGRSLKAEYDALGRPTARIDKQGNRTELRYDPRGMLTGHTLPDGRTASSSYDAAGRMTVATDARGAATQYDYNAANKLLTATYQNGTVIDHEYDALGRLVSMSSSQGQSFQMAYDPLGRIQSQTDVLGRVTHYGYSPGGRLTKTTDPLGNIVEYAYNESGAVTLVTLPDGSSISYSYDDFGRKTSETDQYGHTTCFEWTAVGQLKKIIDPAGHATEYSYNDIGYLIAQTDANGHTTRYEYDKLGRMVKKTLPLGMSQTYSYGERSVTVTDYNGETTEYEIDQQGRIAQVHFSDGSSISSTYTASGELAAVTDRRGMTTFAYDDRGRLLRRVDPDGRAISYTYDSFGRLTSVSVPSGITMYDYDDLGRLSCVTAPDGQVTNYSYDQRGNVERVSYPNNTEILYGYDSLNRVTSVEHRRTSGERLALYTSTFGAKGERLSVEEDSGRRVEYGYDKLGQLIAETITEPDGDIRVISYTYDPVGNRLTKNDDGVITHYTHDHNDRLLTENGYAYTYDENGNLLTKSGNGKTWQFDYNVRNQLIQAAIEMPQGSSTIEYQYDYEGTRVSKTINGTQITTYLVDKNRPYAQVIEAEHQQGALNTTVNYVYGHSLISQSIDGVTSYYHHDGSQSVRALSNESGTLSDTYAYDAYGNLLRQSGDTQNPYRYRSEAFDSELDAYYLRARYYQPGSGRLSSIDPVEGDINVPLSLHRYLYAYNDPVNNLDPSGGMTLSEGLVTAGVIGILSATTIGYAAGEVYEDFYLDLAENLLPDAGVIGLSGMLSFSNFDLINKKFGDWLFKDFGSVPAPQKLFPDASGVVGGIEGLWSFGSSQLGIFWYIGLQGEVQGSTKGRAGGLELDLNLSTGYVWNLWNCDDYTGWFSTVYSPIVSAFWDPEDMWNNTGPWGFSWSAGKIPLIDKLPSMRKNSSSGAGISGTFYKYAFMPPIRCSYGELAASWAIAQSLAVINNAYNGSWGAALATTFAGAWTGVIAKSKEIYNRTWVRTGPNPVALLHEWRSSNSTRPTKELNWYRKGQLIKTDYWRSGPEVPWAFFR